jgi:hypothetical protein
MRLPRRPEIGKSGFLPGPRAQISYVVHFSQFLLFRQTAAESRGRRPIKANQDILFFAFDQPPACPLLWRLARY